MDASGFLLYLTISVGSSASAPVAPNRLNWGSALNVLEEEEEEEVEASTAQRGRSDEEKMRTVIPKHWHPALPNKTTVGLPNARVDCYRNVVFQMLLHMPILHNWLIWYMNHHAPRGYVCKMGEDFRRCQVCELAEVFQSYWANETRNWIYTFRYLARTILLKWKPNGENSEQDPAEYFVKVYNAIKEGIRPMMKGDFEDMFEVGIIQRRECAGENPCAPRYTPSQQPVMLLPFSEHNTLPARPTLGDVVKQYFENVDDLGTCPDCGGKKTSNDRIGRFPELLVIQLNRANDFGQKIQTHVYLTEQLNIETRFMDERWGNERKVVRYKLTSMVLHFGQHVQSGHYMIAVKGKGGQWSMANDTQVNDWDPEGPESSLDYPATCYLFTYRRLPTEDEAEKIPDDEAIQADSGLCSDDDVFENVDPGLGLPPVPENTVVKIPENTVFENSVFEKSVFGNSIFGNSVFGSSVPENSVPESGASVWGVDPRTLEKLLEVIIPKAVDTYIARSADARHKEWDQWSKEWAKEWEKRRTAEGANTTAKGANTTAEGANKSAICPGCDKDMVNWQKQRGRLQVTLTENQGNGEKILDLEVQGLHYNRLKRKVGKEADKAEESAITKVIKKKLKSTAKGDEETETEKGKGKAKPKVKDTAKGDEEKGKGKAKGKAKTKGKKK
ncbi:hypothetical protein DTO013E5_6493 [Penicillium roqueforti]|nr:hypothetical protein CBS147355_9358 [Penicillium roqueforti]KAI2672779.1 hypothetical protein LCP963914a_9280 [Penicillium roqueforti]KAI2695076.1 hypothetical protein CBS147372_9417 [Penicillium roqueforti]KAI2708020.1 hypothetical protein CBS147354_9297 [Penicillium roqueforti]KAI2734967.1 hypothetical protein DTO012A1_9596 [Penicillium roqueforti]